MFSVISSVAFPWRGPYPRPREFPEDGERTPEELLCRVVLPGAAGDLFGIERWRAMVAEAADDNVRMRRA